MGIFPDKRLNFLLIDLRPVSRDVKRVRLCLRLGPI